MTSHSKDPSYLAQPASECCLQGSLHMGERRGRIEVIADVETYIASPPADKANGHILLYFPDVWGFFLNAFLMMDTFADAGYLVLGLNYFRGDPVWHHRKDRHDTATEPGFDYTTWKAKHTAFVAEAVPRWIAGVKAAYGRRTQTRYACVGYCFGAPYVCEALVEDGTCDVGAFAHPALLKEGHFRGLTKPLFLSCAETDRTFGTQARRQALDILQDEGKTYHLQLFSGVEHGFALRGRQDFPYERWVKEQSLRSLVEWFNFWLAQ